MAARGHYRGENGRHFASIDGNVVRRAEARPETGQRTARPAPRRASERARKNREKALHMTLPYVAFLAAAAVVAVLLCVQYLQLQAAGTAYRGRIARLEGELNALRQANDTAYEEAISSVSMEQIKDIAVHELGMVYADEGQVIRYSRQNGDYIRQYGEIPRE